MFFYTFFYMHKFQNEESKSKKEQKKEKMYDSPRYQTTTTVVETTEYIGNDGPAVRVSLNSRL